jgi:hypothetical protein
MAVNLYAGSAVQLHADPALELLARTHADMNGFLDYVAKFHVPNFRITEDDVSQWRFDPVFDDADGWRGVDSVRTYYHAGHGGMSPAGVFEAPLGAVWANRSSAFSSQMSLGDQKLRYLFISTCDSIRVTGGHDPIRTWMGAHHGLRMIFGFGSLSLDAAYGGDFFRRWNSGISFSRAWLETSWGVGHDQIVVIAACGATDAEAADRVWNERLFFGERVLDEWYWWLWVGHDPEEGKAWRGTDSPLRVGTQVPPDTRHFRLERSRDERAAVLAERFGIRWERAVPTDPDGGDAVRESHTEFAPRVVIAEDRALSILVAPVELSAELVPIERMRASADEVISVLSSDGRHDFVFDRFTVAYHAGASRSGNSVAPDIGAVVAHYRQSFDGVPVVRGGEGHVSVTLDRSGRVCGILDRSVEVSESVHVTEPSAPGADTSPIDVQAMLDSAQRRHLDPCGAYKLYVEDGADEVGYRFAHGEGRLVALRDVTVEAGGMRKRHRIEIPLATTGHAIALG